MIKDAVAIASIINTDNVTGKQDKTFVNLDVLPSDFDVDWRPSESDKEKYSKCATIVNS